MEFFADFHIHSKYSRATAANLDLENLYMAAQTKGITVIGTGDFTHPAWWAEIREKLVPAEEGLFALKDDMARACNRKVPQASRGIVRFMLVTEISNIYKKHDHTRKNHNLVFLPDLEAAERFNRRLDKIGNIRSDGRPILGLDARHLLEIVLETSVNGFLVPAHVWTPWFSLLGSKSGFDAVDECFEDLSKYIFALETGLSSDPPMNWRISALDRFTLVSNSDAHSPAKLGREANAFDTALEFSAIRRALDGRDPDAFRGTIEFFPEEGKYHLDGHRKCGFRSLPEQTRTHNGRCPVCGKALTLGVLYRVEALADRPAGQRPEKAKSYTHLIPLEDVLSEIFQCGVKTKKVQNAYQQLIERHGSEFDILRTMPVEELDRSGVPLLAEAIKRMRDNQIQFDAGFDGEFGKVRIFAAEERSSLIGQQTLFSQFSDSGQKKDADPIQRFKPEADANNQRRAAPLQMPQGRRNRKIDLNAEQQAVVDHSRGPMMVIAGPGTGKTRTITCRVAEIMKKGLANAGQILAVTFTNKAAEEMRIRLRHMLARKIALPWIATFHGFCWRLLQETFDGFAGAIADESIRRSVMDDARRSVEMEADGNVPSLNFLLDHIMEAKQRLLLPDDDLSPVLPAADGVSLFKQIYTTYQALMTLQALYDFEELILQCVRLMEKDGKWRRQLQKRFSHVFVDEFQDINYGQYRLIRQMVPAGGDICVIGDPDQAIYGFRGSDVRYFNQFSQDYPETSVCRLTRNYRSTETILKSSFQVLQCRQIKPADESQRTYSLIDGHKTITIMETGSPRAEAVAIGRTIEQMVGGTGFHALDFNKVAESETAPLSSFSDFGILYRTTDQGRLLADVLSAAGIPCQLTSRSHRQQPGLIKLMAVLRVVSDQVNYADLIHIIDLTSPGISKETLFVFKSWAFAKELPPDTAIKAAMRLPVPGLSTARQQRLVHLFRLIERIRKQVSGRPVSEAAKYIIQNTRLASMAEEETFQSFFSACESYAGDWTAFFSEQMLQTDTDYYHPEAQKVTLMTMHAAKGLEFPVVFIAGCEEGLVPYHRPGRGIADIEEERRLFYVAMTRAKERLFITWARKRSHFGRSQTRRFSPFAQVIEKRLKAFAADTAGTRRPRHQQLPLF